MRGLGSSMPSFLAGSTWAPFLGRPELPEATVGGGGERRVFFLGCTPEASGQSRAFLSSSARRGDGDSSPRPPLVLSVPGPSLRRVHCAPLGGLSSRLSRVFALPLLFHVVLCCSVSSLCPFPLSTLGLSWLPPSSSLQALPKAGSVLDSWQGWGRWPQRGGAHLEGLSVHRGSTAPLSVRTPLPGRSLWAPLLTGSRGP